MITQGWIPQIQTLIVVEGLSYYLTKKELEASLSCLTKDNNNWSVVVEYLKPSDQIDSPFDSISSEAFYDVRDSCELSGIIRYDRNDIRQLAKSLDGTLKKTMTLFEAEQERTLKNYHFPTKNSGWIEISYFSKTE